MLRAMWRELETELRNDLYGYEWGKPVIMLAQSESDVPIDLKDAAMASVRPRTT
jgi:isocitrate dehydrogenase